MNHIQCQCRTNKLWSLQGLWNVCEYSCYHWSYPSKNISLWHHLPTVTQSCTIPKDSPRAQEGSFHSTSRNSVSLSAWWLRFKSLKHPLQVRAPPRRRLRCPRAGACPPWAGARWAGRAAAGSRRWGRSRGSAARRRARRARPSAAAASGRRWPAWASGCSPPGSAPAPGLRGHTARRGLGGWRAGTHSLAIVLGCNARGNQKFVFYCQLLKPVGRCFPYLLYNPLLFTPGVRGGCLLLMGQLLKPGGTVFLISSTNYPS